MCGIAGCYQQADGRKLTDVMTDRIAHRGPDARGIWSHEDERVSLHLGHRRLSIIDLSAAADQPLSKGNLTLIYNGELYNFEELRARLQADTRSSRPAITRRSRWPGCCAPARPAATPPPITCASLTRRSPRCRRRCGGS